MDKEQERFCSLSSSMQHHLKWLANTTIKMTCFDIQWPHKQGFKTVYKNMFRCYFRFYFWVNIALLNNNQAGKRHFCTSLDQSLSDHWVRVWCIMLLMMFDIASHLPRTARSLEAPSAFALLCLLYEQVFFPSCSGSSCTVVENI